MRVPKRIDAAFAFSAARETEVSGFQLDTSYNPIPITPTTELRANLDAAREQILIVRGTIEASKIKDLESQPNVIKVWKDTKIEPFGVCPIQPCDCTFGDPAIGNMGDVARYLGVDQIWAAGIKGEGIAIGIVDGGITAVGRPIKQGEAAKINNVVDGWPADWGTTAAIWADHGNMSATDALGMAPNANIYDIRIADPSYSIAGTISNALAGFEWAIQKHRDTGKPQILSNSWGIFREELDPEYARNPDHLFTRKVVDALNEGIIVLFAAGNCGQTCPDIRCHVCV